MKLGSRLTIFGAMASMAAMCLLGIAFSGGQAGAQTRPANTAAATTGATAEPKLPLAEEVFKNIQVFRGLPVNEFMATMGFFTASLNESCEYCHEQEDSWEGYAVDNEHKKTARKMVLMMNGINQAYFGGRKVVTCFSCHNGGEHPRVNPTLASVYSAAGPEEPDEILKQAPDVPSANEILDKYIQALGGTQRLSKLTSFVAKGTFRGFTAADDKGPVELFAKSPSQRTMIIHTSMGDNTTTYDGRAGWSAVPGNFIPVLPLAGADLDGAKVEAELAFPERIKQSLTDWLVGFPATIDNRTAQVVQGKSAAGMPVKLYFDAETGLLMRLIRFTKSPLGRNTTQIDYTDYRDVSGVKMPFRMTVTWLDGRSIIELSQIQANVTIEAAKFAKPMPPKAAAQ